MEKHSIFLLLFCLCFAGCKSQWIMKSGIIFKRTVLGLFVSFLSLSCCYSCSDKSSGTETPTNQKYDTLYTYTNSVGNITNIGDPYILKSGNQYYLYATSSPNGFKVWESDNMVDWTDKGLALQNTTDGNSWGTGNFWAPEVKFIKNKFYMVYSATGNNGTMKIRIASSSSPLGPFINYSDPFFDSDAFSYIDGDLFIDDNGQVYLFYVKDCSLNIIDNKHVSQIYVVPLSSDLKSITGEPRLLLTPSQSWEGVGSDYQWNEGPFCMKHEGVYYLFYSSNYYASADYSVGYATATDIMGTWSKYANNPVLKKDTNLKVSGPGHCCVTVSPDSSEFFMVYHTHTHYDAPSGDRNVCIDRLVFKDGVATVIGPSKTPQKLPSGDKPRVIKMK
jgi:beta-xylosidase